jgi:hypothetical protein
MKFTAVAIAAFFTAIAVAVPVSPRFSWQILQALSTGANELHRSQHQSQSVPLLLVAETPHSKKKRKSLTHSKDQPTSWLDSRLLRRWRDRMLSWNGDTEDAFRILGAYIIGKWLSDSGDLYVLIEMHQM